MFERRYPSWAGISKLIERVARNGQDEDLDVDGFTGPEEEV